MNRYTPVPPITSSVGGASDGDDSGSEETDGEQQEQEREEEVQEEEEEQEEEGEGEGDVDDDDDDDDDDLDEDFKLNVEDFEEVKPVLKNRLLALSELETFNKQVSNSSMF